MLEDNYPDILRESMAAFSNSTDNYVEDAYRFLFQGGNWDQVVLFTARNYTEVQFFSRTTSVQFLGTMLTTEHMKILCTFSSIRRVLPPPHSFLFEVHFPADNFLN